MTVNGHVRSLEIMVGIGEESRKLRLGFQQPSHQFVSDLADYAILSLDPNRVQRQPGDSPSGDHRVALFTAAGLIEVTPESITHWNEEVIARLQRKLQKPSTNEKPYWREVMLKLIDFQMQGNRCDLADIAQAVRALPNPNVRAFTLDRLKAILMSNSVPTASERIGLARAVGLNDDQISLIETAVENGQIEIGPRIQATPFSRLFDDLASRLSDNDITLQELSTRSIPLGGDAPAVSPQTLSNWRTGRSNPSLSAFRGLVRVLERFQNVVSQAEIEQLINASGFSPAQLNDTTHDIIERINGDTKLKPLLVSLRNASDLDVSLSQA
jgi:transcriptional regulator with XRE-family HTH domain